MSDLYTVLEELKIKYTEYKHKAVFTCDEAAGLYEKIPGTHVKNLFIKNKNKSKYWLVIVKDDDRADMNQLRKELAENKLSFASPEDLYKYLKLTPGSVSPFGLINDAQHEVIVVLYNNVLNKNPIINFHPNINTATLGLTVDDFKKYLKWCGNKVLSV